MTQDVLDFLRDQRTDVEALRLGSYTYDFKSADDYVSVCMHGDFRGASVPIILAIFKDDTIIRAEEGSGDLAIPFGWAEMVTMARDAYMAMKAKEA